MVLPFVVFLINIFLDTHNSTKFYNRFIEDLNLNDSLIIRINLSERQLVKNRINFQKSNHKNIVLGSSRSMLIGKPIGLLVDNYSMSGAIINDFEVVYNHLRKKDSEIDTIFLEISPWIFNQNVKESRYKDFNLPPLKRRIKKFFSIKYLKDNLTINKYLPALNEHDFIKYSDGTIRYDSAYRNQDNIKAINNFILGEVFHLEGFNSIKKLNANKLILLIEKMINDGVKPVFIKYPYPPLITNEIIRKYPNIKHTESLIDSLAKNYKIKTIGIFEPEKINIKNEDFYDAMHLTPIGMKKLFRINKL